MPHPIRFAAVALLAVAAACGSDGGLSGAASTSGVNTSDELSGTVTVLAAASLTGSFTTIAAVFEAANPDVDVVLSFDGSSKLATQIVEGVPGDVFASADEANLAKVTEAGATSGETVTFATNVLQIVVAAGNPLAIEGLEGLSDGVVVALCRADVPCGAYTARAFDLAGLAVPRAGLEDSVKGVVTKVQLGEADAGIVYRTDVLAAKGLAGIDLPADERVRATYPASVLADASNPRAGAAFVAFLVSAEAQGILAAAGFGRP